MALFGRKAKDATLDPPVSGAGNGAAVETDAPPAKGAKRVKAAREPKAVKNKLVKNGVAVGLNIGNHSIKAVEVTSKNGELSVTGMGAVPTPPESYANGNVLSVSALTGAIKELWRVGGIRSKVAVTSVAGTGALVVRVIEVPKMTDGELSDNMKVDADRYIPFPPSEVVMDFKALRDLPSDPDAPNMEVLLAAAQREVIDMHIKVVQSAKLDPRAIDVEPIAATRALQLEKRGGAEMIDYNEVTGVINLGATGAEISILRGDIVVFTRAVPNGGNAVTQAIADGLGLPFSDAEVVKIQSADALAPAGYGAATGADDFGFGATGGEDFDFGGEEFSGGDLNTAFNDISANPTAAAASDDPFDLDFFNQGPKNNEPGAGHAQKEGEPPADNPAPTFSFDFGAPTPPQPPADPAPPADAPPADTPPASSGLDFSFGDEEPAAASASPAQAVPPPPPTFNFGGTDEFNTEFLPAVETAEDSPQTSPASAGSAPKPTAQLDDTPTLPATPPPSAPQSFSTAMPSAFDFDNFDLPTSQPASSSPAPEAAPVAFGFDAPDITPDVTPAAAPAGLSFEKEPAPAPQAAAPQTPAAGAGEFDLDAIFGAPAAAPAPSAAPPAPGELGALDATIIPKQEAPGPGDFDLSAIGTDAGDDFGLGAPASGDDFTAFGAGLSAAGASTDAATLYSLIYPPLEELSNEVRRSLEFHLGRYPDATISRLVLLGGGAKLRNLDVFFTQMLGVPATVANPFAHIAVQTSKLPPDYATENGPTCAVALGLALRDFVD